jgi:RHH-type proline utilization regulon transcriptional repressor/proline dehydrogenase/delta 1-pyrroline-5-carboxylate dehydrogenase
MIGAVVGVQPFGGEGLSGTGPKAGGPHYLRRLVRAPATPASPQDRGPTALPGPTGESNTLCVRPRERVACIADTEAELLAQARLASGLGSIAIVPQGAPGERVQRTIGARCEVAGDPLAARPDAVLFAGAASAAAALRRALADREGPLVPVIVARDGGYDAARLMVERTVTINTTASGGNASLLSLEEAEPA